MTLLLKSTGAISKVSFNNSMLLGWGSGFLMLAIDFPLQKTGALCDHIKPASTTPCCLVGGLVVMLAIDFPSTIQTLNSGSLSASHKLNMYTLNPICTRALSASHSLA